MDDGQTRVLLAVMHLHERYGRLSVRDVSAAAGLSLSVTHKHLTTLRNEGLVAWEPGLAATIRPTCEVVR